jgi:transposase-like protein
MPQPQTLKEAITYFADLDRAHAYIVGLRWPNGVACPRMGCGSADVRFIASRRVWRCKECKRQFSAKVGTIFEDSPLGFDKWLPALWMLTNCRNGISSYEIARGLSVTQKTAWFMLHRLRLAMKDDCQDQMIGPVEADETFVGARRRVSDWDPSPRKHSPHENKTIVFGMVERSVQGKPKGRARAIVVPDVKGRTLLPKIVEHVARGATVYTDEGAQYRRLKDESYVHFIINHAQRYVDRHITTNRVENFWSCLKRTLGGTYIAARPFHLERYLDEQIFRFNVREYKDPTRFDMAGKGADGRRLTWKVLTDKTGR